LIDLISCNVPSNGVVANAVAVRIHPLEGIRRERIGIVAITVAICILPLERVAREWILGISCTVAISVEHCDGVLLEHGQAVHLRLAHHAGELQGDLSSVIRPEDERFGDRFVGTAGCDEDIEAAQYEFAVSRDVKLALTGGVGCVGFSEVKIHFVIGRGH